MKNLFTLVAFLVAFIVSSCSSFDDTEIWDKLNDHEKRIVALEELCKQMNTNISALQTIVNALQKNDYITNVAPVRKDGVDVGYTITFAYGDTITIYHGQNGKDGVDGKDGYTPKIGVMKDSDGIYYWTIDGEWLLDGKGNKIQANGVNGSDGTNGSNGQDGTNGVNGADGITPRLKIENDYWYVSYDNGSTWIELGKATGEDGKDGVDGSDGADGNDGADGEDGKDGDNIFNSVTQDDEYVYFNLADGTMITLPKHDKENIQFEDLQVKAICCKNWDTNNDGELSYAEAAAVTDIGTKFKGTAIIAFNELKYFTGITDIPNDAFNGCTSLWKIIIPDNIVSIADSAFDNCNSIVNFIGNFSSDDNKYLIVDGRLIAYARGYNESTCIIPEGTSIITSNTFKNLSKLESITFPNSLTEIHSQAFYNCDNLTDVTITSATSIGESAFKDCDKLVTATIDATTISIEAFSDCDNLITASINATSIGVEAFSDCDSLETVTIGPDITLIEKNAFWPNKNIKNIYLKAIVPPALWGNSGYHSEFGTFPNPYKDYIIYVPSDAVSKYTWYDAYSTTYNECKQGNWGHYTRVIKPYDFE